MLLRALLVVCLVGAGIACDIKVGKDGDVSVDVASGKASDEWQRTYSLAAGGRLDIVNTIGRIEAGPAAGPQVEVLALREVHTRTEDEARARLAKVEMIEDVGPDHVRIQAKTNDAGVSFGQHGRVVVNYQVKVPAGLVVSLRTENGAVRVENVEGRFTLASTNGPIVARALSGAVDASTVNGAIEVGLGAVTGDSKIVTINGPATLRVAPGVSADLEAAAINGGVSTRDELALTVSERTNKRVTGRLNNGGPRIVIQTTNGGVRVGVAEAAERGSAGRRAEAGG